MGSGLVWSERTTTGHGAAAPIDTPPPPSAAAATAAPVTNTIRAATMSMRVHNADHFEELRQVALRESSSPRSSGSPLSSGGRHSFGSPLPSSGSPTGSSGKSYASELLRETQQKRVAMKHDLYIREQEALQKKLAESIAENLQKQRTKREAQFMKLWKEVEDGKSLAEELREKMDMQDQSKQRQVQRMYAEWSADVYHKLNDPIVHKVAAVDSRQLNAEKHDAYQKFLDITNKKGGLFRDIIIESEYNPLSDLKCLTYHTPVDDPVKRVIRRREEEDAIAREGSGGAGGKGSRAPASSSSLCRDDNLDTKLWSQGVFESTPYGYFHKLMSSRPTSDGSAKTHASRVKLDHYDVEVGPEALRRELPKGKRTAFDSAITIPKTTIELR